MKTAATYEDIDSIYPNPNNPRQNKHVIGEVAKSIARFGFSSPIIARQQDRQIIAGHTRYAAAVKLKMKTIPVRFLSLDEYEATALALADNRLAEKAKWNEDKLQNILQTLSAEDIPLDDIGFTRAELEYFLNQNNTEDDAPPIDDQSDHPPNDLQVNSWYNLGVHSLYIGDCKDIDTWGGDDTALIFDPPWDQEHDPPAAVATLAFCDGRRAGQVIEKLGAPSWIFTWDCMNVHYVHENRPLQRAKHCLFYGNIDQYAQNALLPTPPEKKRARISKGRNNKKMRYTTNPAGTMLADVYTESIAHLHKDNHEHAKPAEWLYTLIANCFSQDKVHDPYAGSGATLIATDRAGKTWTGAEKDPEKAKKIIELWEQYEKRQTDKTDRT
jgi:hypothetical protein